MKLVPVLCMALIGLASAEVSGDGSKQFPLFDYPPYEGVCDSYSAALSKVDPSYAEHLKVMENAVAAPGRPSLTVLSEMKASARIARGSNKHNRTKAHNKAMAQVKAGDQKSMDECLSNKKLQEVDFEDVYVASNLLKACEDGAFEAPRKSGAYNCRDACVRHYPMCAYFSACVEGCVMELKLATATQNDDLSHQMAINPDGVFNVKRDPGYTAPANNPMIPAALEHKQEAGGFPAPSSHS